MNQTLPSDIEIDKEGFLRNIQQWNTSIAETLANNEHIQLTAEHWEIIHLLREFYQHYEHAPAMRALVKYVRDTLGTEKGQSIYLLKLFPGSPAKIASKIAGLPKPDNCL